MVKQTLALLLFICLFSETTHAQRYLVLDVSKAGGMKRIRFAPGDELCYKLKNGRKRYCGTILQLGDSAVVLKETIVPLREIKTLYRNRSNFLTRKLSTFFLALGVGFVSLDTFNSAINNETPLVKKEAAIESGAFLASGLLFKVLPVRRHRIGWRNSLKIIDISP